MSDHPLSRILAQMQHDGGAYTAPLPANWMQGRTSYGGLSAALLLAAARRDHPDLPPLRSALISFVAPVGEPPRITSQILRQGRNVTWVEARARIGEQVVSTASFSFGAAQQSAIRVENTAPPAPEPGASEPLIPPQADAMMPGFLRNFDLRLIEGERPFSGSDRGYLRAWARHCDPDSRAGVVALLCLADILPPAVIPMFPRIGTNSSMTWICNFLDDAPTTKDGWWQMESRVSEARDGYSSQVMRMWNSDGRLVVEGMQSVVIFV